MGGWLVFLISCFEKYLRANTIVIVVWLCGHVHVYGDLHPFIDQQAKIYLGLYICLSQAWNLTSILNSSEQSHFIQQREDFSPYDFE